MTLKKKFTIMNLVMLILPVMIISIVTAMLFILFITKHVKTDILISGNSFMNPAELGKSMSEYMYSNPVAIRFVAAWTIFCIFVIFITNTIIAYRLSQSIINPVSELKSAAKKIEHGDLDFEIMGCSYEEINSLCTVLNNMRIKLRESREAEKRMTQERSMLLAHLSHDLKTPITSIKGYAQGILDGVASTPEKEHSYLETIIAKTNILENLAGNLSEYSHLELSKTEFKFTVSDFCDFISEIYLAYKNDFEKYGIALHADIPKEKYPVNADFEKLYRVFSNLLDNAIKYRSPDSREASIRLLRKNGGIYTVIEDDGIGIADDKIDKVFDDFYRVDTARSMNIKGNGLGLGIARQITEKHGGKIWLRSGDSGGTAAIVYLPEYKQNKKGVL
ncbi:MAG: HAMP domain-containing histidine kinase [Clostridia bacterium]|nr:HAMP domain-containing histidine kinase [Clostridia bacterium]